MQTRSFKRTVLINESESIVQDVYLAYLRELRKLLGHYSWTFFLLPKLPTSIIMDDEAYFPLKDDKIMGNKGFYVE